MTIHPDQRYMEALLHNDKAVIREIYLRFSEKIKADVLADGGSLADAAVALQKTLLNLYRQARFCRLRITCPFGPFLLSLCRKQWLSASNNNSPVTAKNREDNLLSDTDQRVMQNVEMVESRQDEAALCVKTIGDLNEKCREIIVEAMSGASQDVLIAESLGISVNYLRMRKARCLSSLIRQVDQAKQRPSSPRIGDIVMYIEKGMSDDRAAHFEHGLSMDPILREDVEKYYRIRMTIQMGLATSEAWSDLEALLSDLNDEFFARRSILYLLRKWWHKG